MSMDAAAAGLRFTKNVEDNPGNYNLSTRNCTTVAIEAGEACGLALPRTTQTQGIPFVGTFSGLNPADLGEDLMLQGGERHPNPPPGGGKKVDGDGSSGS